MKRRILLLKRVLVGGSTGKAIVKNLEIEKYIEQIISAWNVPGLYNIQLRLTKDGLDSLR